MRILLAAVMAASLAGCTGSEPAPGNGTAAGTPTASPAPSCSASELEGELPEQEGLPASVAELREEIHEAALACDVDRLEQLALAGGSEFTASFGDSGPPGRFWAQQEEAGQDPLRMLALVLRLPPATTEVGQLRYVWPAAFARESWDAVTPEERLLLREIYDDRDIDSFEQFGAYVGYRVVITADGDWQAFVAGD